MRASLAFMLIFAYSCAAGQNSHCGPSGHNCLSSVAHEIVILYAMWRKQARSFAGIMLNVETFVVA